MDKTCINCKNYHSLHGFCKIQKIPKSHNQTCNDYKCWKEEERKPKTTKGCSSKACPTEEEEGGDTLLELLGWEQKDGNWTMDTKTYFNKCIEDYKYKLSYLLDVTIK